jgi:hypothetical protein
MNSFPTDNWRSGPAPKGSMIFSSSFAAGVYPCESRQYSASPSVTPHHRTYERYAAPLAEKTKRTTACVAIAAL